VPRQLEREQRDDVESGVIAHEVVRTTECMREQTARSRDEGEKRGGAGKVGREEAEA